MADDDTPLLAGTLDLLILKTLTMGNGVLHGYAIAQNIQRLSKDALRIEEGSLYPALQRMQVKGWLTSEAKTSPTGRRARYYRLTAAGRKQLERERKAFERSIAATTRVLRAATTTSPPTSMRTWRCSPAISNGTACRRARHGRPRDARLAMSRRCASRAAITGGSRPWSP
jgi:PadR family transcriptional regulator, regulatory protein PadR